MYIKRQILNEVLKYLDRKEFIAIIGPRQAGKTTLLQIIQEKLLDKISIESNQVKLITFQDPRNLNAFENNPVNFIKKYITDKSTKTYFLIDEFQYAKNAGSSLKLIYDTIDNIKVIITGSSSLEIRNIASSMVGRLFTYELRQLEYNEIIKNEGAPLFNQFYELHKQILNFINSKDISKKIEDLNIFIEDFSNLYEETVLYGTYPAVYTSSNYEEKETILLNIYNSYVEKDIVKFLKIGKTDDFFNFIKYLSITMGQLFNSSSVQRELGLTHQEVNSFLTILEQTYIIKRVRPFYTNKTNELKKSPLIYFYDTGLRNWSIRNFNKFKNRTDIGHLIENSVFNRILFLIENVFELTEVKFWRKSSGAEVDFILEKRGESSQQIPIEVKFTHMDRSQITRSYRSFLKEYKPKIGLVITEDFLGMNKFENSDILFIPACVF